MPKNHLIASNIYLFSVVLVLEIEIRFRRLSLVILFKLLASYNESDSMNMGKLCKA